MKRITITPRQDWEKKIIEQGFLFYKDNCYYNETAAYEFTYAEIELIENATADIFEMCMAVVDHVIVNKLWDEFLIPMEFAKLIEWSWNRDQPAFYGRFDFGFNNGIIKLLEFNADTPTLLLESSVIQWYWLQDFNSDYDQFNNIHEMLVEHIQECKPYLNPGKLYFTASYNMEDFMTVKYMQDVASQAGFETEYLDIDNVSLNDDDKFIDVDGNLINNIFKIYPYEWMFNEPFGKYLITNKDNCTWIEPPYKAILSNKMLLKYLYELFPNSPYLLSATFLKPGETGILPESYAKKPVYAREGANVSLIVKGISIEANDGEYGDEGFIYQQYFELPEFDGRHPIIGSWVIGGKPAGIGIRESAGRITNVTSSFCPHYIKPD